MDFKKYFNDDELRKTKEILILFHDKILLDKKIKNPQAIILSTYMVCNEQKKSMVKKESVKKLFVDMGRTTKEFDKALYEISGKRKGKTVLVMIEKDLIGLNFNGLKIVKKILEIKNGNWRAWKKIEESWRKN